MDVRRTAIKALILGAAISITTLFFTWSTMKVPGWHRLARSPGIADGVVVSKHPEDRNKVSYTFVLGEQTYSGRDGVGNDYERINPGDKVRVFYDPKDPDLSMLIDTARETYQVMVLVSLVFALVMGFPGALFTVIVVDFLKSALAGRLSIFS